MKNKKLFFKIYVLFIIIFIIAIVLLSILGNKTRIGYLSDFSINIESTLELNNLEEATNYFIVNNKLDEKLTENYIITNQYIQKYNYNFKIKYYDKIFRNSDIYDVYIFDTNKILDENNFIEEIKIRDLGSPFGNLITSELLDIKDIDNVEYNLKLKQRIYYILLLIILIYPLKKTINFILKKVYIKSYKTETENINLNKNDYVFLILSLFVCILLFSFQYWLCFPGYYYYSDTISTIMDALNNGGGNNANPLIISMSLGILYSIFGYKEYHFLILNLLLWYIGLYLIIFALYIKFRNKFIIFLYLISFIANNFFLNINHIKDVTATLWVWFSYSLMFFTILVYINNKILRISIKVIAIASLIIGMLWRHNFIVTIYPIFIFITYSIMKNNILEKKKYISYFIQLMLLFALCLVIIYKAFPGIFATGRQPESVTNHLFLLQIAGSTVLSDDASIIPDEWYNGNKTFEDLKDRYLSNPINADILVTPWFEDDYIIFKRGELKGLKTVWLKSIIKHPVNYAKHMFNFIKHSWTVDTWKINAKELGLTNSEHKNYSKQKGDIYSFLYKYLPDFNILIFVLISFIISIISIYIFIFNNKLINSLFVFALSVSLSSSVTAIIVATFSPIPLYRYIHTVEPLSIIALISFIAFMFDVIKKYKKLNN